MSYDEWYIEFASHIKKIDRRTKGCLTEKYNPISWVFLWEQKLTPEESAKRVIKKSKERKKKPQMINFSYKK